MREKLNQLSKVTNFLGYTLIIFGVINFFAGIIGIISGAISIFLGVNLLKVSENAREMLAEKEIEEFHYVDLFNNLVTYFNIQSVLIIVGLLIGVFGLLSRR
ncbi:DUF5362 family protein [Thermohalobacter berrensis]|uniref:Uncharacterized protein n=1 Tax=Thermohalobacter berrensis TaxID=99594 RepID=A0A419SUC0_9FIRM|nr:DUF5362 family protein [Thermohalobacter berrensis]RKD28766.1 hypothetical protein BET03_06930 [Thermohalobacter berrensis]